MKHCLGIRTLLEYLGNPHHARWGRQGRRSLCSLQLTELEHPCIGAGGISGPLPVEGNVGDLGKDSMTGLYRSLPYPSTDVTDLHSRVLPNLSSPKSPCSTEVQKDVAKGKGFLSCVRALLSICFLHELQARAPFILSFCIPFQNHHHGIILMQKRTVWVQSMPHGTKRCDRSVHHLLEVPPL